jgi:hypothetical protein
VSSVLNGRPVTADERHQLGFIPLIQGQTGGIVIDFQRGRFLGLVGFLGMALQAMGSAMGSNWSLDPFGTARAFHND